MRGRARQIAGARGPSLTADGLLRGGLGVIGDYLTEVNGTSATCGQDSRQQTGCNVAGLMLDAVEHARRRGVQVPD